MINLLRSTREYSASYLLAIWLLVIVARSIELWHYIWILLCQYISSQMTSDIVWIHACGKAGAWKITTLARIIYLFTCASPFFMLNLIFADVPCWFCIVDCMRDIHIFDPSIHEEALGTHKALKRRHFDVIFSLNTKSPSQGVQRPIFSSKRAEYKTSPDPADGNVKAIIIRDNKTMHQWPPQ